MPTDRLNNRYPIPVEQGEDNWNSYVEAIADDLASAAPEFGPLSDRPDPKELYEPYLYFATDQDPITGYLNVNETWVAITSSDTFSGNHANLTNVQSGQHHDRYTNAEARSATALTPTAQTADYSASNLDCVLADASGGALAVTLPAPTTETKVVVKKTDASGNAVTIATPNAETIDGQDSLSITGQGYVRTLVSDGTNYFVI